MVQSEALGALAPALSWMFLPPLLTNIFLQGLYQMHILTPPTNPAQAQIYKQRAQAFVGVAYFVYTVYAAFEKSTGQGNFYRLLGVDIESDTETIRRSFRKLARIYHPDKIGAGQHNEQIFTELRRAHDTLVNPTKRLMYDRIGPVVLGWNEVSVTQREMLHSALRGIAEMYIIKMLLLGASSWFIRGEPFVTYWSLLSAVLFFSVECSLLLHNDGRPAIAQWLLPTHTIYDLAVALRETHSAIIMGSNHISAHLPKSPNSFAAVGGINYERKPADVRRDMAGIRDGMEQHLAQTAEVQQQASRAVDMTLFPLRPPVKASTETLQEAAARAAAAHAKNGSSEQRPPEIKPSAEEETFMYLMSKAVYRARLLEIGGPPQERNQDEATVPT